MNPSDPIRPWLDMYDAGVPLTMVPRGDTIVSGFREAMRIDPQHVVIRYFDWAMTMRELDQASDGLAAALQDKGFVHGDRLAVYLQNVPQFVMASLAAWKLGGIVVTVNPMYQARELHEVLSDSGAKVLVCLAGERLGMALETAHAGRPWWDWEAALARRDPAALAAAAVTHADELAFWHLVQWCFETQWSALKTYANARGVAIMGDLPIFVAHHSADCWARPDLYFLDDDFQPTVVAGVPPDFFSATGQRWGNPLYRWDRMAAEGHAGWVARVRRMLAHVDLFRIDHFRGFAGYWEVPAASPTAIDGRWVAGPGKPLFDAIEAALGVLPIVAEDLGVVTPDVEALLEACGYPGMRVLQFAFGDDASHAFLPHNHVPNTVVYTGTHDNDTLAGWWQAAPIAERRFVTAYLGASGEGGEPLHWQLVRAACLSVARLAIFPLQDLLGLGSEHRMNTPGLMGGSNWAWRFDWTMVGTATGPRLAGLAAVTGRADFARFVAPAP